MKQEILNQIIEGLLTCALLVITGYLLPTIKSWVNAKTNNELVNTAVQDLVTQADVAVNYLQQTMVAQLKEDGKFDAKKQKKALETAVNIVLANISQKTVEYFESQSQDIETVIIQYIESNISSKK